MAVDGLAVTFCTARRGLGGAAARPGPSSLYQMWQPTHQRPVYLSPHCCTMVQLCGFNVPIEGLIYLTYTDISVN